MWSGTRSLGLGVGLAVVVLGRRVGLRLRGGLFGRGLFDLRFGHGVSPGLPSSSHARQSASRAAMASATSGEPEGGGTVTGSMAPAATYTTVGRTEPSL